MPTSLYLINPALPAPYYVGAEVASTAELPLGAVAEAGIATVAALAPADFDVTLCDERVMEVDWNISAEMVGLTGRSGQQPRMIELAREFRSRGKVVIIGGPLASLNPDSFRDHCDILVCGELEGIAEKFFADLRARTWQARYDGGKPDLTTSPLPRWDLYPNDRMLVGSVQTSRGCPFSCEFCDVIQYVGRKQRHKEISQILAELEALERVGYRTIFLSDDNLTADRPSARVLLAALAKWNEQRPAGRMQFITQLSIDVVETPDLLNLLGRVGSVEAFVGLETPNADSLNETGKRQNLRGDLVAQVHAMFAHGIGVMGGMIVGFDSDGPDIFTRQLEFARATAVPIFSPNLLTAPVATPLYDRMRRNGRLVTTEPQGAVAQAFTTNIIPVGMTAKQLQCGFRWLVNRLYHPREFGERVLKFIEIFGSRSPLEKQTQPEPVSMQAKDLAALRAIHRLAHRSPHEATMLTEITRALTKNHEARALTMMALLRYAQIRHMYDQAGVWEPLWVENPPLTPAFN